MTAPDHDSPHDEKLHEQLVAYLDGELDDGASREIEDLLVSDRGARNELHSLERAWDLLDELPRSKVDDGFTRSTIEMVAVAAQQQLVESRRQSAAFRFRNWLIGAGSILAAGLLGFLSLNAAWQDPDQRLIEDLPILTRFDPYVEVQDVAFLRELEKIGFSSAPPKDALPPDATLAQRREIVARLPANEKDTLARNLQRMNALKPAEQLRLRELHTQIESDDAANDLRSVLAGYHDWLQDLPLKERTELLALGTPERLERIKQIWQHPADREAIAAQIEELMVSRLNRFPDPNRNKELSALPPDKRRSALLLMASSMLRSQFNRLEVSPQTVDSLKTKLTPAGREKIDRLPTFEQQRSLVTSWMRDVVRHSNETFFGDLRKEITDEELGQFYTNLSDDKKAELTSFTDKQRQDRLRWMYVWAKKINELPKFVHPYSPDGPFGMGPRPGGGSPSRPGGAGPREGGPSTGPDGSRGNGQRGRNDGPTRTDPPADDLPKSP